MIKKVLNLICQPHTKSQPLLSWPFKYLDKPIRIFAFTTLPHPLYCLTCSSRQISIYCLIFSIQTKNKSILSIASPNSIFLVWWNAWNQNCCSPLSVVVILFFISLTKQQYIDPHRLRFLPPIVNCLFQPMKTHLICWVILFLQVLHLLCAIFFIFFLSWILYYLIVCFCFIWIKFVYFWFY